MKKIIRYTIKVRNCDDDFGLGPGILAITERVYSDPDGKGFDTVMFAQRIREDAEADRDEVISIDIEEIN